MQLELRQDERVCGGDLSYHSEFPPGGVAEDWVGFFFKDHIKTAF